MAAQCLLREHELAVHRHLEDPSRRLGQADLGLGEGLTDLRRQTGGARLVVSDDAVFDRHPHPDLLA